TMIASAVATTLAALLLGGTAFASSHREAPNITKVPKVDGTDFYMFRSYETTRENYVTILANYLPFQNPAGGPNFYQLDPQALYDINIDNNGDAIPDLTFRFRFRNFPRNISIPVNGIPVAVPLNNIGPFKSSTDATLNLLEGYTVEILRPGQAPVSAINTDTGDIFFIKPFDNVGTKSVADYARYAERYKNIMAFDGCASRARVFVGQRSEGFKAALGELFDLVNLNPVGAPNAQRNDNYDKSVTSLALEVPISCLTNGDPVIGGWTTASLPVNGVQTQVSRLGMPLVNEVVIGLPDKDKFNASNPRDDAQFATYVTNPTLPELLQILFPTVTAPNAFPRTDLIAAFLTGISGLNQPATVRASEMLRLNTSIAPISAINQQTLGVLAGDTAGFPNGRRPGDDVVDIELRVAMGVLLPAADAPSGQLPFTDGAAISATDFRNTFPYLNTPYPGNIDL
ncbi:MAG: DUF4331 domain-containing protein, partial [Luteimonas sp.]